MARYGQVFKDRAVARLLPPESSPVSVVAREVGIGEATLQRWLDKAQSMPALGRAWTGLYPVGHAKFDFQKVPCVA